MLFSQGSSLTNNVIVKVHDTPVINAEDFAFIDHCKLRKWCHANVKCEWNSYHIHTSDDNRAVRGVGFVVFEFACPKEALKFKLWAG